MRILSRRKRRQISTWARHQLAYGLQGKPRPRVVFIHVPKTGGVTVGRYYRSCFGLLNTGRSASLGDTPWYPASGPEEIAAANRANFVGGHMSWAQVEQLDDTRPNQVFTFLRDATARLWSMYDYLTDYPEDYLHSGIEAFVNRCRGMPVDEFFTSNDPEILANADNYVVRQLATSVRSYPVPDEDWPALTAKAKANLASMAFVGLQESFNDDFLKVLKLTHLPAPAQVPHMNRGVRRPRPEVSPSVAEAMDRLSKWDREVYEYARSLRGLPPRA